MGGLSSFLPRGFGLTGLLGFIDALPFPSSTTPTDGLVPVRENPGERCARLPVRQAGGSGPPTWIDSRLLPTGRFVAAGCGLVIQIQQLLQGPRIGVREAVVGHLAQSHPAVVVHAQVLDGRLWRDEP